MENVNELLYLSRMGGEEAFAALLFTCGPIITCEVKKIMADNPKLYIYNEDFAQEARIQIIQAVMRYREDKDCKFTTYITAIIQRRFHSLVRHYSQTTYVQMHDTLSLDYLNDADEQYLYDLLESNDVLSNPIFNMRLRESIEKINKAIGDLKPIEKKVYDTWQKGKSYKESSEELGITIKAYDGHIQRVKRKLRKAITRSTF